MTKENLRSDEAQIALDSVEAMQSAGFSRASTPRWFGAGLASIIAIGFSLYAMEDPGSIPVVFLVLGMALFVGFSRKRFGAFGKEMPDTRTGKWAFTGVLLFLVALFFSGIALMRALDLAWVPLVTGFIAGLTVFILAEREGRYYRMRAAGSSHR